MKFSFLLPFKISSMQKAVEPSNLIMLRGGMGAVVSMLNYELQKYSELG
jgi:hypothetical protein